MKRKDLPTLITVAALSWILVNISHETLGHAGFGLLSGFKVIAVNTTTADLESFLDNSLHESSSLQRTISLKDSSIFYVVTLLNQGIEGMLRAELSLIEQNLFYRINDKEIHCGQLIIKN